MIKATGRRPLENDTVKFVSRNLASSNFPIYSDRVERKEKLDVWLREYHEIQTTTQRQDELRDLILLNVFYLFPYILSTKRLRASMFEEAMQNMVIAVLTAIDKFDPNRGSKFTSYIAGYLRDAIDVTFRDHSVVKQPNAVRRTMSNLDNIQPLEVALSQTEPKDLDGNTVPISWSDFNEGTISTQNSPKNSTTPEGDVYGKELLYQLEEALSATTEDILGIKERVVISYRYGVFGVPRLTLEQVAKLFRTFGWKATKEWIFQLERKGLETLRKHFATLGYTSSD